MMTTTIARKSNVFAYAAFSIAITLFVWTAVVVLTASASALIGYLIQPRCTTTENLFVVNLCPYWQPWVIRGTLTFVAWVGITTMVVTTTVWIWDDLLSLCCGSTSQLVKKTSTARMWRWILMGTGALFLSVAFAVAPVL